MMKKSLAFVLIFVIISSIFVSVPAFAASEGKINLLTDLGILEEQETSRVIVKGFSRSDFAKALSSLDSAPNDKMADEERAALFASDISKDENSAAICEMLERGIMDAPDKLFAPEDAVTRDAAVDALIKILGYEPVAKARGNNRAAYDALAVKLGILKGVNIQDHSRLTQQEVAKMLYNSMGVPFFVGEPVINPIDRCFFDSWNLTEYEGKVLANSNLGLGMDKVSFGNVNIDGKIYKTEIIVEDALVGTNVTFFTRYTGSQEIVVSITGDKRAETLTINASDIASVKKVSSGFEIVYDEDKEIIVEKGAFLIVNNKTLSPSKELFGAFKSGTLTLTDTDGNGDFDLGHMSLLVWGIAEGVSPDGKSIVVRTGKTASKISLDKADTVEVYMGRKISALSDVVAKMPIGMACDSFVIKDNKVTFDFSKADAVKLYASNRTEAGFVDAMTDEDVFLGDIDYKLSEAYFELVKSGYMAPLKVGEGVKLYFDRYGEVVYYEVDSTLSKMRYGYLIDADIETKGIKKEMRFKVLDINGSVNVYRTKDKKFILDGVKTNVNQESMIYLVDETEVDFTKRQVIRYSAQENIMRSVDTSAVRKGIEDAKGSLTKCIDFDFYASEQKKSKISGGNIDRKFVVGSDCIVFIDEEYMDSESPDEKRFMVGGPGTLGAGSYDICAYDANDMNEIPYIVYYKQYGKMSSGGGESTRLSLGHNEVSCYVIESITERVDENGEEGWGLKIAGPGGKKNLFASKSYLSLYEARESSWTGADRLTLYEANPEQLTSVLASGDVIRYTTTADGKVNYIEKFFDFDKNKANYPVLGIGGTTHGFVNIEKNSATSIMYSDGDMFTNPDITTYVFKNRADYTQVPVYDVKKGTVKMCSYDELPTAAKGNKVKAFVRYYDFTWIFDYVFYLYE